MTIFGQNFLSQNPKKSSSSNFLWFKESTEFFVAKSETKNFPHFKGLWFLSKVQNQRYGPLKRGKFFCSDFAAKNSVDYLNHKKFDEQLFLGIWNKKFWSKMTIFLIWSQICQIWNLRILTKKVENWNFWLFQRLRGLELAFFVADFKNEVRFYLSPPVFAQIAKNHKWISEEWSQFFRLLDFVNVEQL